MEGFVSGYFGHRHRFLHCLGIGEGLESNAQS
jgi:hypothetical protein